MAMKLTRGKLIQQEDWNDWLESEYHQLNQYTAQGMFGNPVVASEGDAIFHLVQLTVVKRLGVYVMDLPAQAKSSSLPRHTQIAWIKQVHDCSILSPLPRIC
jgi:hypothetical protein